MFDEKELKLDRIDSIFLWKDSLLFNDLKCLICKYIAFNPKICVHCEKIYCQVCEKDDSFEKMCNHCKKGLILKEINFSDLEFLNKIELKCVNKDLGCPFIISYKNYISHIGKCLFKRYKCKGKNCNYQSTLSNMELHILSCVYIPEKCRSCKTEVRRIDMDEHVRNCIFNIAFCPYCKKNFPKNTFFNVNKHNCFDKYFEDNCFKIINHFDENISSDINSLKKTLFLKINQLSQSCNFLCKKRKTMFMIRYKTKLKRKLSSSKLEENEQKKEDVHRTEEKSKKLDENERKKLEEYRINLINIINKNRAILLNKRKYL